MKTPSRFIHIAVSAIALLIAAPFTHANTDTWTGAGGDTDPFWISPSAPSDINWNNGLPQAGADLIFNGTLGLINSNNISSASFNSITFATPSGAFDLKGIATTITGGITNNQVVTAQTIEFPIILSGAVNVDVTANGSLTLTNTLSGSGSLSKSSGGTLTLKGRNTFAGPLTINGGTVAITSETNLSVPPTTPTAGNIVLNGGALQTLTNFGFNTNRGIALGPTSSSGYGILNVSSGTTLTNGSIMANNGGIGGLTKIGTGNLILFGVNTYTGPTTNTIGNMILDFTRPTAPQNNIINSSSSLSMGSGNAGSTAANSAQLTVAGILAGNSQTFAGANFAFGASVIVVTNNTTTGLTTLSLGAISHTPGAALTLLSTTNGTSANIQTSSGNNNGILGGWMTIAGNLTGNGNVPANAVLTGTNYATVAGGNIVNFNNYFVFNNTNTQGTLHSMIDANTTGVETNLLLTYLPPQTNAVVATVDNDGAASTTDINSIKIYNVNGTNFQGSGIFIGANNTLRLGQYGGILSDENANITPVIGGTNNVPTTGNAPGGSQNVGILTAGGPTANTPGEIVITHNNVSETSGGLVVAAQITDNGSSVNGPVTIVKMGPGSIKLDGHNTYSGGLYLLQGRVQFAGAELINTNAPNPGTPNPDGGGTGPIYVLPGCYLTMSSISATNAVTNAIYIAGIGDAAENFGVFRGGFFSGPITMIGDATIGADNPSIAGPISGPYDLTIGPPARNGIVTLGNSGDNWTGNTILAARNANKAANNNVLISSNNEIIPNGFGYGNVSMTSLNVSNAPVIAWDLNGFNETINGFSSQGANLTGFGQINIGGYIYSNAVPNCLVFNGNTNSPSTLTIGDNNQGGIFGGVIATNSFGIEGTNSAATNLAGFGPYSMPIGIIGVTKIGAGVEIFTNMSPYTGNTVISNGILQMSLLGSIPNSAIYIRGGTFDVSPITTYSFGSSQVINVTGGTLFVGSTSVSGTETMNFTNGTLKVTGLTYGQSIANLTASTINLGGSVAGNLIQAGNVPQIPAYPAIFPVATYGTLNGNTNTLGVNLPGGYSGFASNDIASKTIYLVLSAGPITPQLTWAGFNYGTLSLDSNWNFIDADWTNKPAHNSGSYSDGSLVVFNDSGLSSTVNLTTTFAPANVTVTNNSVNYTFIGTGAITGTNGFDKEGVGKLTLDNTGGDSYNGLTIGGGIVQMGINDTGGSLGTNGVANNGTLVFNRVNSTLLISNAISGSGGILVSNATSTTTILSGNNGGYNGSVYVQTGQTLAPANAGALSSTNGTVTIPTGTTLDVSGSGIAANTLAVGKMVQVAGAGVDGTSGAIVNNVATNQQNALLRVTLAGDTTFGGTGARWDIRGTPAQHGVLSTGGNLYNVIKKGAYFMSIANVDVDTALSNVDVQVGTLEVNGATTGMGNSGTLTIENGATLQLYNMTNTTLNKSLIVLNGDGLTTTLTNALGNNVLAGQTMLSNSVIVAVNTGSLALSNYVFGTGTLTKSGTNTLVLTGPGKSYSGATTVSDGTLLINNSINSGSVLTENQTATASTIPVVVGGNGTNGAAMDIEDTLWPGVSGKPATFGAGSGSDYVGTTGGGALVFNDQGTGTPKAMFSLNTATTAGGGVNDLVTVNGNFNGNFASVLINPLTPLTVNSPYTLVTYTGNNTAGGLSSVGISVVGAFQPSRYTFSLDQTSNPHKTFLTVLTGAGNLVWNNAASTGIWDTNAANANWLNTGTSANDRFYQLDAVTFNDSIGAGVTTINIATTNVVPGTVTVSNTAVNYTFYGNGSIGGAANLVKQNSGTLTLSNANTFTGTVTVKGGTLGANGTGSLGAGALQVYGGTVQANSANLALVSVLITNGTVVINNSNALGVASLPVYVTNSGTLDLGGASFPSAAAANILADKPVYISGWGVNSNGCIVNNGTNNLDAGGAIENIIMTGDAAIGGMGIANINAANAGRWDLRGSDGPALSTGGNAYNLYKVGTNQVSFVGATIDASLADVFIMSGQLGLETSTSGLGNPNNTVTIASGASLEFYQLATNLNKKIIANGGGVLSNTFNIWFNNGAGYPLNTIIGPVTITNGLVAVGGAGNGTFSNAISGPGTLAIATGNVSLDAVNTYTGNTIVSNGATLFLRINATINNSPNINLLNGTVNVAQRANSTLTLAGSQTLSGVGTVAGTVTAPSGTTVTVGTNGAVSQLTVTTNVNLSGTLNMKLDKGNATNDLLAVGGQVNYGGSLNLNNLSGTLANGDSFKLFNAGTYGATGFASITPAHPNNDNSLNWDTSLLTVSGTLKIVSAITPTPVITSISLSGTTLTFTATNGTASGSYALLSSTNVALPLSQWKPVFTNSFNGSGDINLSTNVVDPSQPQTFYILQVLP